MMLVRLTAICLAVGAQLASAQAIAAPPPDFSANLRRSIAIAGSEDKRFRVEDRMAHYLVPGVSAAVIDKCRIADIRNVAQRVNDHDKN